MTIVDTKEPIKANSKPVITTNLLASETGLRRIMREEIYAAIGQAAKNATLTTTRIMSFIDSVIFLNVWLKSICNWLRPMSDISVAACGAREP